MGVAWKTMQLEAGSQEEASAVTWGRGGALDARWPWEHKDRFERDLDLWTVRGRGRRQDVMVQFHLGPWLDAGDIPRETAQGEQQLAGRVMCEGEGLGSPQGDQARGLDRRNGRNSSHQQLNARVPKWTRAH